MKGWAGNKTVECWMKGRVYLLFTGDLEQLRKENGSNVRELLVCQLRTEL